MHCPTLNDLPSGPAGKTGWPWTEDSARPEENGERSSWPRISVLTPSYNQAPFIEEAVRSVLLQGYPNLEYIVIDGGSLDGTVNLLEKYDPWIAYRVSEKDHGQSHALNKGLRKATGEIIGWLNADDVYLPGALSLAAKAMRGHEGVLVGECEWITGSGEFIKFQLRDHEIREHKVFDGLELLRGNYIPSSSVFFHKKVMSRVGPFDEELHYAMDWDYWVRATPDAEFLFHPEVLSRFRVHDDAKTWQAPQEKVREFVSLYERWLKRKGELGLNRPAYLKVMYEKLFHFSWLLNTMTGNKAVYKRIFRRYYRKYVSLTWKNLGAYHLDLLVRWLISPASYAAYTGVKSRWMAPLRSNKEMGR